MMDWVDENGAEFIKSQHQRHEIRDRGLFVIMAVWVTGECAVKLTTGKNSEFDLSLDLGEGVCKMIGIDDSDDEAEKENLKQQEPAIKRLNEKLVQIRQIENDEQKTEEWSKFLEEDPQAAAAATMGFHKTQTFIS
jgi:hypothetical protein